MSLPFRCGCVFFIPWLRYITYVIAFLYSLRVERRHRTHLTPLRPLSTPLPAFLNSFSISFHFHREQKNKQKKHLYFVICTCLLSLQRGHTCGEESVYAVGGKGEEGGVVFCTLMGLWRNLPVRSELGEEEPVGCGTPDKGDIYTLTLDHWSERRQTAGELHFSTQETTPGLLFFLCVCLWKTVRKGPLWIHS